MKKFKLTLVVETEDDVQESDFVLVEHDVIDGFELTRSTDDDITADFKIKTGYIEKIEEFSERSEKIKRIKEIIKERGDTTAIELELESSPCLTSLGNNKNNVSALIEGFHIGGVSVFVYQDQDEIDSYELQYEELDDDILDEVANIIDDYDTEQYKTNKRIE